MTQENIPEEGEKLLKVQLLEDESFIIKDFDGCVTSIFSCQDSVTAAKCLFAGLLEDFENLESKSAEIRIQIKEIKPLID